MDDVRIAFIGFRHAHIHSLYERALDTAGVRVAGACEEHGETRRELAASRVEITHGEADRLLDEVECDAVAVGDVYALRGRRLIAALERGAPRDRRQAPVHPPGGAGAHPRAGRGRRPGGGVHAHHA